jgi:integrase
VAEVRKAPGGRPGWQARYYDPAGRRRTKTFKLKEDARAFANTAEADIVRGQWIDPAGGKVRFEEWFDRWWTTTVNLRPSTRARDESYARNHLLPHFGTMQLAAIDHFAIRSWVAELAASGLAPATVVKAHQLIGKVLRAAVDAQLIPSSPAERVPLPRVEREEMRFLGPDEIARLAATIDPRYRALVLVGAYGGLRAGELFGLRRRRVELLHARVEVAEILVDVRGHQLFGSPKTRAGHRTVPLPRSVTEELASHLGRVSGGPDDLVFTAPHGGPIRASGFRRRVWLPAVDAAGLAPLRLHDLRHTAVALWIAAGASSTEIATRAGHSSVSTVLDRYGHLLPERRGEVTDALEEMAQAASGTEAGQVGNVVNLRVAAGGVQAGYKARPASKNRKR